MTIKEIANVAGAGETTIRRWAETASAKMADISAKMAKAKETSKPADFTLPETIAIIRAGGNETLADLLATNAKGTAEAKKSSALPSGAMLKGLIALYGTAEAGKRLDHIIGYQSAPQAPAQIARPALPEPIATDAQASQVFINIRNLPGSQKAQRTGYAVAKNVARQEAIMLETDRLQQRLPM